MTDPKLERIEEIPTVAEYIALRDVVGWGRIPADHARRTLDATTFCACLRDGGRLAGLVRVLGDGVLYIFIADVVVHPDYAGQGLGDALMRAAVAYIEASASPWATVTLIPLAGREAFYARHGFEPCPNTVFGAGMAYTRHLRR